MARINPSTFRNWNNGETMNEADYEKEREMLYVAINDSQDQLDNHKPRIETLEVDNDLTKGTVSSHEERLSAAEVRIDGIDVDIGGFDAEEARTIKANTDLFYLHNSHHMRAVTFQDLKDKQITYGTLKHGLVRFYAFKFFRYPDGGEM